MKLAGEMLRSRVTGEVFVAHLSISFKENVVLYFSAVPLFRCFFSVSFRVLLFRDSDRGTRRKRKKEREKETKGREKKKKERKRQKVGTIQLVVRVSQSLNWITVAVTAGRELLFNSLKLYAWRFRYLSRQPLLSAITPCTLSLAESLDYYTFIPAPRFLFPPLYSFQYSLLLYLFLLPPLERFTLIFTFSLSLLLLFFQFIHFLSPILVSSSIISSPFKPFLSSPCNFFLRRRFGQGAHHRL